ncbi:MAG: histidinol-phosphate transaminase, partial [Planctomycetes bacterium]|nr:histidinol-phosphate transaminase [Planctomycetota bacterium]
GWTKLNTNENPYAPSPKVVAAVKQAAEGRLNIYPDPLARRFCIIAAELFGVDPDCILPANGSDENLTILMRSFVDAGETISSPYPSYILYETLADLQGAKHKRLTLNADWSWNHAACRETLEQCKLVFVPNPNSPSGNRWSDDDLLQLLPTKGILVLDEAYGDFCDHPHQAELLDGEHGNQIVITRSLSKSYSLAGIRFGFAIADPELIFGMRKVKDSYNCNMLSLAAAVAAMEDQQWMQENVERIRTTRTRLTDELRKLGFDVVESQANFVWITRHAGGHREIYEALKQRRILIRYMQFSGESVEESFLDGLRITVGTDEDIDRFLESLKEVL